MRKRVQAFHIFPHSQNKRVGIDQKNMSVVLYPILTHILWGEGAGVVV